jgi:hypothetical protein
MLKLLGNYDADLKVLVQNKGVYVVYPPKYRRTLLTKTRQVSGTGLFSLTVDEATDIMCSAACVHERSCRRQLFTFYRRKSRSDGKFLVSVHEASSV